MDEILIHKNQTELNDYLYDYEDKNKFKCKKCIFAGSSKISDYVCTNSLSDEYNKDVYKCDGCNYFEECKYEAEGYRVDDKTKSLWE